MRTGWFKFHRQIFDNPICTKDSEYFFVWCYLLTEACYEEKRVLFKNEEITLLKGQLLVTTNKIATELNISESKVNRILKTFEIEKQIEKQTSNKNTLITVLNWDCYQSNEKQNEEQVTNEWKTNEEQMTNEWKTSEEQMTNEWKTSGEPSYYNKEYKNNKELKEEKEEVIVSVSKDTDCQTQDVRLVIEQWNQLKEFGIAVVSKISPDSKRGKSLKARISEYGIDEVIRAIDNIKHSDFLQGKSKKGWTITFDWFVLPNNFPKVLEGNYNDKAHEVETSEINNGENYQHRTHSTYVPSLERMRELGIDIYDD